MSNPTNKTELQRLMEERDATLACLAVCKAAQASVEEALQRITEEHQHHTRNDGKHVISSLSELIETSTRQSNQRSQTEKPYQASGQAVGDTANPSQNTDLAHRQRGSLPVTECHSRLVNSMDGRKNSAAGSQGESCEVSFVMVENFGRGGLDKESD